MQNSKNNLNFENMYLGKSFSIIKEVGGKICRKAVVKFPDEPYMGDGSFADVRDYLEKGGIIDSTVVNPMEVVKEFMDNQSNIYPKADNMELIEEEKFSSQKNMVPDNYNNIQQRESYLPNLLQDCQFAQQNLYANSKNYSANYYYDNSNPYLNNNLQTIRSFQTHYANEELINESTQGSINQNKRKKTQPMQAAELLINRYPFLNREGILYYFFNGYYKLLTPDEASTLLIGNGYELVNENGTPKFIKDVYEIIRLYPSINVSNDYDESRYIAFNNCILDIVDWSIIPNDGRIFVTNKIDSTFELLNYMPATPIFDKYLFDISGGDSNIQHLIWEALGYYLTSDNSAQCFFVLYGLSNSGKSVFGEFLRSLFNREAIAAIDLHDLGGRFDLYSLIGKKINLAFDLPNGKISSEAASKIKMLTGNDLCKAEGKFKDSIFFKCNCKFIFSSNFMPVTDVYDPGFARRLKIIPFAYSIPPEMQDKGLVLKLLSEKEAIIYKALKFYIELRQRNYIFTEYNPTYLNMIAEQSQKIHTHLPNMVIGMNNIIKSFIDECCNYETDAIITNLDLFNAFTGYCVERGIVPIKNQSDFTKALKSIIGMSVIFKKIRVGDKSLNGITGISLKNQ